MAEFILHEKSKVKRILPAAHAQLLESKLIKIIGVGNGSVKAIALVEKLKKMIANIFQNNSIRTQDNLPALEIVISVN